MDKIIEKAKSLREDIDNLPEVKEYYRLKTLYENDKELHMDGSRHDDGCCFGRMLQR